MAGSPGGMFRRPPRNFRGRRRAASSGSSEEEPPVTAAPPPARRPPSDSEGEGDPGSAVASPDEGRAGTAEGPLPPEEPTGSPGSRQESGRGRGPRLPGAGAGAGAGAGPPRGGKALLSFGGEEERDGKKTRVKVLWRLCTSVCFWVGSS